MKSKKRAWDKPNKMHEGVLQHRQAGLLKAQRAAPSPGTILSRENKENNQKTKIKTKKNKNK